MTSEYYQIKTGYGPLHVHIDYDETGPKQIFCNLPPLGTEISGLASSMGILISKYLEIGGDARRLIKHLNSVKGDKPIGFGENRVDSIPHAISVALKRHLENHPPSETVRPSVPLNEQMSPTTSEITNVPPEVVYPGAQSITMSACCPSCYSPNVSNEGGCSVCKDCGHSSCA